MVGSGAAVGLLALSAPSTCCSPSGCPSSGWRGRHARENGLAPAHLRRSPSRCWRTALVLAPWTIHNAVELDRFVPISTGGGKALFIGTYLEADGDAVELREELLAERPAPARPAEAEGPVDDPTAWSSSACSSASRRSSYPGLETDAALGRLGRQNLEDGVTEEPLRFAGHAWRGSRTRPGPTRRAA